MITEKEEIREMPVAEKVKLMEAIWADICRDPEAFDSPAWHEAQLKETEERYRKGLEQPMTIEEAKRVIAEGDVNYRILPRAARRTRCRHPSWPRKPRSLMTGSMQPSKSPRRRALAGRSRKADSLAGAVQSNSAFSPARLSSRLSQAWM